MPGKRPLIGITGPDEGGAAAWFFTAVSVFMAGGKPIRITPSKPRSIEEINGLIIGGGADVEPVTYGENPLEKAKIGRNSRTLFEWILSLVFFPFYWLGRFLQITSNSHVDRKRDGLEFGLLAAAVESGKPVLGICRGMQLMNVHFKGSLHQDISGFYGESAQVSSILPSKRVRIEPASQLSNILQAGICHVNALHNQAIKKAGEGIKIVARELNTGIYQAIEHEEHPFIIGVQWHPEYMIQIKRQRNIFRELVKTSITGKN